MGGWKAALDAAGVRDRGLRGDYTRQRRVVARFRRSSYLAARLLLPGPLLPHVVAATAFMHHADTLLDSGPRAERADRWAAWEGRVRDALRTGTGPEPVLRALAHSVAVRPALRGHVAAYLETATTDLDFAGFATEADYQDYLDRYSLPAFMMVAGLLEPDGGSPGFQPACRAYIDGSQRLDFVNDLAEDLSDGRLNLPAEALERFGVTRRALERGESGAGTAALLGDQLDRADAGLAAARGLVDLVAPRGRPLVRALIDIESATARAARARGTGLLRGPAGPPPAVTVRVLLRERRWARRSR